MGLGVNIGIHPKGDRCLGADFGCDAIKDIELRAGLDVKRENAGLECRAHFVDRLADAGEHDLLRITPGGKHASKLSARDDVGAGAKLEEQGEHGQVGVCFDRVADQVVDARKRFGEHSVVPTQRGVRIDVGRRSVFGSDLGERSVFAEQFIAAILEVVH